MKETRKEKVWMIEWNITLTLVNLDANQNNNAGKTFNGTLMIQKDKIKFTLSHVCSYNSNLVECVKN